MGKEPSETRAQLEERLHCVRQQVACIQASLEASRRHVSIEHTAEVPDKMRIGADVADRERELHYMRSLANELEAQLDVEVALQFQLDLSWAEPIPPAAPEIRPSKIGIFLICVLAPAAHQEEILGDLFEDFNETWLPQLGVRMAQWMFIWHAMRSSIALIGPRLLKWGFAAWLLSTLKGS